MEIEKEAGLSNESPVATFTCTICEDKFHDINVMEKHIHQLHDFRQSSEDFCDSCKTYVNGNFKEHKCRKLNESVLNKLQTVVRYDPSESEETVPNFHSTKLVHNEANE